MQIPLPDMWEQSELLEHGSHLPAMQADAVALLQSAELRHSTQAFLAVSQSGAKPPQLPLPVHCTQVFVVMLHTGVAPEQFESLVHWTQRFVAVLQVGLLVGQ